MKIKMRKKAVGIRNHEVNMALGVNWQNPRPINEATALLVTLLTEAQRRCVLVYRASITASLTGQLRNPKRF